MKFGTKKDCSKQITEIKAIVENIKKMTEDPNLTEEDYLTKGRIVLNMAVIQTLIGAEFQKPKKDGKDFRLKFNKKLPNKGELADIVLLMNDYIREVENPFLEDLYPESETEDGEGTNEDADDMGIPVRDSLYNGALSHVPTVEKWNGKKLKNYIFGYDGKSAMSKALLTGLDCINIAAIGEDVRKKSNRNRMLIIGGVALLITGGVVAGVMIHEHNKKDDKDIDDMIDDIEDVDVDEISVEDIDEVEVEDVPSVEME